MVTKNILLPFLLLLIFTMGCADNPVSVINTSLNTDFKINFGHTVYISNENLFIKFSDVVEDSRCPEGAYCIVPGTARIKLLISQENNSEIDTLNIYTQSIVSVGEINNSYIFQVKNLTPLPKVYEKINKQDYILTLHISHFTYGFSDSEINNKTGIFGQVYISGGPALRNGYIDREPFQTTLKIVNNKSDTVMVPTDFTGRFIDYTPAGNYKILSSNRNLFPRLIGGSILCTVNTGKMTFQEVDFDNGVR